MKKIASTLAGILLISSSLFAQTLVASYPFNGNANDASGNGHNGTVTGAALTTDRFGNANSAYNFNGTSNKITVPDAPALRFNGPYTIVAWVQPAGFFSGTCQINTIVNKGQSLSQGAYNIGYSDNHLDGGNCGAPVDATKETFFSNYSQSGTEYNSFDYDIVQLNKWYMVTSVFDGTKIKTYINGKVKDSSVVTAGGGAANTDPLDFGTYNGDNHYWLNGKLDDISLYNGVISDVQLFNMYVNDRKQAGSGKALNFTGNNSVTSPDSEDWNFAGGDFGISAWIKLSANSGNSAIVNQSSTGGTSNSAFYFGTNYNGVGSLQFFTSNGADWTHGISTAPGVLIIDKWTFVCVTRQGGVASLYINGILQTVTSGGAQLTLGIAPVINNSTGPLYIGSQNGTSDFMTGQIDELRIFKGAGLTQADARDWMCKKITSRFPGFPVLVAYYLFDEGSGASTYSVGGHPGTLVSNPAWITSAAPLGDASGYDYTTATKSAIISSPTGETFRATSSSGAPDGIQVYRTDTIPNTINGAQSGNNNKYFGVFQVNGELPTYTAIYNYNGNPLVNANNENTLILSKRADNSVTTWTDSHAALNTTNHTLTAMGQSTEYILGSSTNALPLSLISFNGYKENATANLSWQTENEINFSGFEIERSNDGIGFNSIGTVNAFNSPGVNNYSFIDKTPANGINFYRLKQIDIDGKFTYSKIINIDFSKKLSIVISPNPAFDYININTSTTIKEVRLISQGGNLLNKWTNITSSARLNISNVPAGVYIIKLVTSNEIQTKQIIKK